MGVTVGVAVVSLRHDDSGVTIDRIRIEGERQIGRLLYVFFRRPELAMTRSLSGIVRLSPGPRCQQSCRSERSIAFSSF